MDRDNVNFCQERKIKELDRQPSCREILRSCREVQKQFFKEEKNTEINAIKHATQPKIQTTF